MIVSWNWLRDYLKLNMSVEELADKLALSGLNHESTSDVGGDLAIDLEVTSNRPDCLNHLGIAREIGVLFDLPINWHEPVLTTAPNAPSTDSLTSVENLDPLLCKAFSVRLIQGAKIKESPWWLKKRLETLGVRPVSNVVDITNYVLFECGQPLHAYDFDKLSGQRLIVRKAKAGEEFLAINGKNYKLHEKMMVIADDRRPVALAGVMGGLETEISGSTRNILIEAARFDPISVRNTSRELGLFSPSSHRFERPMDPERTDWASRRCAELILDLAGGQLAEGSIQVGQHQQSRTQVRLRLSQIERILGISIGQESVNRILKRLGLVQVNEVVGASDWIAPSWRSDLDREIDLIEEVARVHGYEHIPENVPVPLSVASRSKRERVESIVKDVLTGEGLFEAITFSLVSDELAIPIASDLESDMTPIRLEHSSRKKETTLRPSLVPSLLESRSYNQNHGNTGVSLFEIAHVYLPRKGSVLPEEPVRIAAVISGDWPHAKGLAESLALRFHVDKMLETKTSVNSLWSILDPQKSAELYLNGKKWGVFGRVKKDTLERYDLKGDCSVLEVDLSLLVEMVELEPQYRKLPDQPAVTRDLSLVVNQSVNWSDVAQIARSAGGDLLESIEFFDTFQGGKLQPGSKSIHFGMTFRSQERTLSGEEADASVNSIVSQCQNQLGAILRS